MRFGKNDKVNFTEKSPKINETEKPKKKHTDKPTDHLESFDKEEKNTTQKPNGERIAPLVETDNSLLQYFAL